jgi:hypothetical protein
MKIVIDIPDYNPIYGVLPTFEDGSMIVVRLTNGVPVLAANSAGLESLANHLLALAQPDVPAGCHIHYDDLHGELEPGSSELIIVKT